MTDWSAFHHSEEQSQRRKLVKRGLQDNRSSSPGDIQDNHHLRRAPSAPLRYRLSTQGPAHAHRRSPTLDTTLAANNGSYTANARAGHLTRLSVTEKTSTDLLGARFDSAAVISGIDAVPYSTEDPIPAAPLLRPLQPQPLDTTQSRPPQPSHANTTGRRPLPELATSFQAITGRKMEEIRGPRQRYSDEVKDTRLKKKSGFSSFFNLSSPRRPAISAPENPVHVTHVGYDQETGEFTVSLHHVHAKLRAVRSSQCSTGACNSS